MPARSSRRTTRRIRQEPRLRAPVRKSLLVLECDTDKLANQGLSLADAIETTAKPFSADGRIAVVKSLNKQNLLSQIAPLAETEDPQFRIIVVVAHSNESGLRLASDYAVSWEAFANWVRPFEPKQIILIACNAGQPAPAISLFGGIPTLRDLYASPIRTTARHVQAIRALIPYLLNARSIDADLIRAGQFGNFFLTGGLILRWRRKDFPSTGLRPSRKRTG